MDEGVETARPSFRVKACLYPQDPAGLLCVFLPESCRFWDWASHKLLHSWTIDESLKFDNTRVWQESAS